MTCPTNVLIVPYKSAPPGTKIPVYVGCPDGAVYPDNLMVEVRFAEGTGYSAYSAVANKNAPLLGKVVVGKCQETLVGYITMPKGGVTIGAFASPVKVGNGTLFEYVTVEASSNVSSNVKLTVNPTHVTVVEGDSFKVTLSASAPSDNGKAIAYLVLKTPWGDVYKTTPVEITKAFGISATFNVSTINVKPGVYTLTAEAYFDNKLVATGHISVQVLPHKQVPNSIKVLPILLAELEKWYKKNVKVPGVKGQYDWSFDVTQKVRQVIPDTKEAYLYGWYRILEYKRIGVVKPAPQPVSAIVDHWKDGYEMALLHIDHNHYPQLSGHPELEGWYWVKVPAKLVVIKGYTPNPEPNPNPQPQPGPNPPVVSGGSSAFMPLLVGAVILLGIDALSKPKKR